MIDVRGTSTLVRDALQLYADTQAGRAAGPAKPLANDLAVRIADGLIPTLRQAYLDMAAMQVEWMEESFQEALATAAANGTLLAGFSAQTWHTWGMLLVALQTWLATPVEALGGKTPQSALIRRYIAGEDIPVAPVVEPEPEPVPEPEAEPVAPEPEPEA
jgi:hypothetical protein